MEYLLKIVLVFLEGIAVVLSPCILPILPIILSTSLYGGNKKPFGIIIGFIFSFTCLSLISKIILKIFHISQMIITNISLFLLLLLGIIMLSEKISTIITNFMNNSSIIKNINLNKGSGFIGGIYTGILIGVVWIPCAGPILAAALIQVIKETSNFTTLLLLFSFALGAGLPMLLIAMTGKTIVSRMTFFLKYTNLIKKLLGIIIILTVYIIYSGKFSQLFLINNDNKIQKFNDLFTSNITPYKAPGFANNTNWLNVAKNDLTLESFKGQVVLVDFWTYSCINCIRTIPILNNLYSKYHTKGFTIIGVHSPEFDFEKNTPNILEAILKFHIHYPVLQDNDFVVWNSFKNNYWPAHYLIDKSGRVVDESFGEGNYSQLENNIRALLGYKNSNTTKYNSNEYGYNMTQETYLGSNRYSNLSTNGLYMNNEISNFAFTSTVPVHNWSLSGIWKVSGQNITTKGNNGKLLINFFSKKVYLVMGNSGKSNGEVTIKLDNNKILDIFDGLDVKNATVFVNKYKLYDLVNLPEPQNDILELDFHDPDIDAYVFTFG